MSRFMCLIECRQTGKENAVILSQTTDQKELEHALIAD